MRSSTRVIYKGQMADLRQDEYRNSRNRFNQGLHTQRL